MEPDPPYYRTLDRLQKAAEHERRRLFKNLPAEIKERAVGVTLRFEDKPSKELSARGVQPEAFSSVDREGRVIVVFVMNLYDRFGRFPGEFDRELGRVMVQELAGWAGGDVDCDFDAGQLPRI